MRFIYPYKHDDTRHVSDVECRLSNKKKADDGFGAEFVKNGSRNGP